MSRIERLFMRIGSITPSINVDKSTKTSNIISFKSVSNIIINKNSAPSEFVNKMLDEYNPILDFRYHPSFVNDNVEYASNFTQFFREDIANSWDEFFDIIDKQFQSDKKVSVYNFACSDGSESYSLAMGLIDKFWEEKSKKFFPIMSFDNDIQIIKTAKQGHLRCSENDILRIQTQAPSSSKYCEIKRKPNNTEYPYEFTPKQDLKDKIIFKHGDFVDKLNDIKSTNNLILCRNFWYFLGTDNIPQIAKKLYDVMDESSLVIIGKTDRKYVVKIFEELGFEEISKNIFRKTSNID